VWHRLCIGVAITVASLSLDACVSIDPRAYKQVPAASDPGNMRAAYWNHATYRSRGEFIGAETLADALQLNPRSGASDADTVYVWRKTPELLSIRFVKDGTVVAERQYKLGEGFKVNDKGELELVIPTNCGGGEGSLGPGCAWHTVTLFVKADGMLAAIQSGGGAGVILVVPIGLYARHLSLFAPRPDAPPLLEP
jgi:hypothetical protein